MRKFDVTNTRIFLNYWLKSQLTLFSNNLNIEMLGDNLRENRNKLVNINFRSNLFLFLIFYYFLFKIIYFLQHFPIISRTDH